MMLVETSSDFWVFRLPPLFSLGLEAVDRNLGHKIFKHLGLKEVT